MSKYHAQRPARPQAPQVPVDLAQLERARQRTARSHFRFGAVIALTLLISLIVGILYHFNVLPHPQYTNDDFGIATYQSPRDADGDGVDDQADILQSARDYLATQPRYKSIYYDGGYPDDGYGVCTDVIAFALRGAGYDLRSLVDLDIKEAPEAYDIETPDANIDFRRVKNLAVFFSRRAESLTTNPYMIAEWQGGDIVVFRDHIALVSDKRNWNGVPFLLHHYSPFQVNYEEDVLEHYSQSEIMGHYRIAPPVTTEG